MSTTVVSPSQDSAFLKPFWASFIGPPWVVALVVYFVLGSIRFYAFLGPYPLQELFFLQTVAMWAVPFVFLTPFGRDAIGLSSRGVKPLALLLAAVAGAACAVAFFALGMWMYGDSPDNWCVSLRTYLRVDEMRGLMPRFGLFALFMLPAITLNPIGEEILFRGFIQESFARRFNWAVGFIVNITLFGLVYLYIHGIWRDPSGLHLRAGSAAVAFVCVALIGGVFTLCRTLTGSLWTAVCAHAAFNLGMLASVILEFVR